MVVPGDGVLHIGIRISILWQDSHQRKTLITNGTERAETLHVRDCHIVFRVTQNLDYDGIRTRISIGYKLSLQSTLKHVHLC